MSEMTPERLRPWTPADCEAAASNMRLGGHDGTAEVFELIASAWKADRKLANEWDAAARHLLEHYPEDVFPPNSNTPDAKAGTFARRLLTWLLDPVERARFAALAAEKKP